MRDPMTVLIFGAAVAVDLLCRFFPAHLPYVFPFIFNAPVFLGTAFVMLWYLRGLQRVPVAKKPGWVRQAFFVVGVLAIYFVLQTKFEYLSQHMFFLNRVQAVTIGMISPFCIAIGWMSDVLAAGIPAFTLFVQAKLCASNGEARRLIRGGGARLNDVVIADEAQIITGDAVLKLSAGKKQHVLVRPSVLFKFKFA